MDVGIMLMRHKNDQQYQDSKVTIWPNGGNLVRSDRQRRKVGRRA